MAITLKAATSRIRQQNSPTELPGRQDPFRAGIRPMIKAAIRSRGGNVVFGYLVAVLIGLLMTSIRWRGADRRALDDFMVANPGVIVVFWHERLFAMPYIWPSRRPLCALQSTHADGRMMAACIRRFGVGTIWGSSSRAALSGLRGMLRALDKGSSVAITPDGPRGPARVAARGAVALAQLSGRPILPLSWSANACWRTGGWDRMMIPKPFSRGRLLMGPPIHVPPARRGTGADDETGGRDRLERYRRLVETSLTELGARADALCAAPDQPAEAVAQAADTGHRSPATRHADASPARPVRPGS